MGKLSKFLNLHSRPKNSKSHKDNGNADRQQLASHKELEEAKRLVQLKYRQGALNFQVRWPDPQISYISAQVHRYTNGEDESQQVEEINDEEKGFIPAIHESFQAYWKKYFFRQGERKPLEEKPETRVTTEIESDPRYLNVNPGTITVEGFGRECWNYEDVFNGPYTTTTTSNSCSLPAFNVARLPERLIELSQSTRRIGVDPAQDDSELMEFVGNMGMGNIGGGRHHYKWWIQELYCMLYRADLFPDFHTLENISIQLYRSRGLGATLGTDEFYLAMILGKELLRRLEVDYGWYPKFTNTLWALLTIADQWFRNVEVKKFEPKFVPGEARTPANDDEREAEAKIRQEADQALANGQYNAAVGLYTQASLIDNTNAATRCNKARALFAKGGSRDIFNQAAAEAWLATKLDPANILAWEMLGRACVQLGSYTKAREAFEQAVKLSGPNGQVDELQQALLETEAVLSGGEAQPDDSFGQIFYTIRSLVNERQIEGLIRFAEEIKWPYLDEVRKYLPQASKEVEQMKLWSMGLHDWLFGLSLPGQRFAYNIMDALLDATPSKPETLKYYSSYQGGIVFPERSYWRVRSVVGRVLGCLPGVACVAGWVGPCLVTVKEVQSPRHIWLNAQQFPPVDMKSLAHDSNWPPRNGSPLVDDIKCEEQWIFPDSPKQQSWGCKVLSVSLTPLPISDEIAKQTHLYGWDEKEVESRREFRVSIQIELRDEKQQQRREEYILLYNPIFVTLPPCLPGPNGAHKDHIRRLGNIKRMVIPVEKLKAYAPSNNDTSDIILINATGDGAEVAARAWCAERRRHAVIRRAGGPCMACTLRGASSVGLGVGVVIWVS